jgi:pimeloyl-ACP methyl ester carboxylesterase
MEAMESLWNGYRRLDFSFMEKPAILICPNQPRKDGKWLFKTEYFGAFPAFELAMLERGYYLANLKNTTRWCLPEDTEREAAFCVFLRENFGLSDQCMPVGMSCGGMQAVYLAGKHPELVAALYLDAPVMNLLSCPCGVGRGEGGRMYEEMVNSTGWTVSRLINDRNQPIDYADRLIQSRIPLALICGAADTVVPYAENGMVLAEKYRASGVPFWEVVKPDCDHHPHGPASLEELLAFAEAHYG